MRKLLAVSLGALLWAPWASAQPAANVSSEAAVATPAGESRQRAPLYLLVTDSDGGWSPERQDRFDLPADLRARGLSSSWRSLVDTAPFRRLSYSERVELLAYPERLLASSWAAQLFSGRHVLVLEPLGQGRIQGRLFDLKTGRETALVIHREDASDPAKARSEALSQALEQVAVASGPVVAGSDSPLYHRPGADHLLASVHYEEVDSIERAASYGYLACPRCFPGINRDPLYDDLDRRLGELVASQVEGEYGVAPEDEATRHVQAVGEKVLSDNRYVDQGYRFVVLDSETVNAYAAPTGPIYVTKGLLGLLDSDDELAAVIGHELSHSERKHARRQYESSQRAGMVGILVTLATGIPFASLGPQILSTIMTQGYSRGYELEADRDGMMAAYGAGYDPAEFLQVQEKLQEVSAQRGGGGPDWLQSHPGGEERKAQLRDILEKTALLRASLEALESEDPGLSLYLKARVLALSEDPARLQEYLTRYSTLARAVDHTRPNAPPIEVWDTLDVLLPPGQTSTQTRL